MTIWRRVACCISKATRAQAHTQTRAFIHSHTHTHIRKYAIREAFSRQHWLRERALMLRYTYIVCLVAI